MTNEEIDKWVEDHIQTPENSLIRESAVEWGKLVAHKFYDEGCNDGFDLGWENGFDACKKSLNVD